LPRERARLGILRSDKLNGIVLWVALIFSVVNLILGPIFRLLITPVPFATQPEVRYSHGCLYRVRRELTGCTGGSWSFSREHQTTLSESPISMSLDDGGLGSLEISAGGTGRWAICGCDADPERQQSLSG